MTIYLPIIIASHLLTLGTAVQHQALTDALYAGTLAANYRHVTPENEGKFWFVDAYGWGPMDEIIYFAAANGMDVHYHALLVPDEQPPAPYAWITEATTRYPSIVDWDVVNEGYSADGAPVIPDIEATYECARAARPDARLWYNGILTAPGEQAAVLRLIDLGLVDAVGIEMHLSLTADLSAYSQFVGALSVPWRVSELEVLLTEYTPDQLQQQANLYRQVRQMCAASALCEGVTTWGFTDAVSWQPGRYSLPFDANYQPKPAWAALTGGTP